MKCSGAASATFLYELVFTDVVLQPEECVYCVCSGEDPKNLERGAHVQIAMFGAVPSYSLFNFFPWVRLVASDLSHGARGLRPTQPSEPRLILPEDNFIFTFLSK